ncbi:MAG: helix-turn-helix transcriptional regulator [Firmicutes bacterium]|jgi:transcriptional regulator with XRE-family HTH domain|nr:helix-turn-helix transcriptional regulator [Bacillota bacterium]
MDLLRIGEKLISPGRIERAVERILHLRSRGHSQQEVAEQLGIDRTFISRLESLGEVRKGGRLALIGFPIGNKEEIEAVARKEGVDYALVMTDSERWEFAEERSGVALANELMVIFSKLRDFDTVIFLGSDMRIKLVEAMLEPGAVLGIELGKSPMQEDKYVDPLELQALIRSLMGNFS